MSTHDIVIRGGTVATSTDTFASDVGIRDGKVATLGTGLGGTTIIDATGKLVLPGGIDSHVHLDQLSSFGIPGADDFHSGTISAACGGTTTIMSFCAQHREDALPRVLADYFGKAKKAVIDYSFHLIIANPDEATLGKDLPAAIAQGVRSFKIFMTYDRMRFTDEQILDVM